MPRVILAVALTGVGATLLVMSFNKPARPADEQTTDETRPTEEPPPPPPAEGTVKPPPPKVTDEDEGWLQLPDGNKARPLNGVKNPPRLVWQNSEWSPIVRTERSNGVDWYVHADGSYSTTLMVWRDDLGRADAVSYGLHPRDAKPVRPLPPDGTVLPGQQPPGKR